MTRHRIRWGGFLLLAGCAAAPPPPAPPAPHPARRVTYRPYTAEYRAVSRVRVEQEFAPGQVAASEYAIRVHFSLTIALGDSLMPVRIVVDSVPELEGAGMSSREAAEVAGLVFHGELHPDGRLATFSPSRPQGLLASQLANTLREFFPRLPSGGAQDGDHWSDTTSSTTVTAGLPITVHAVTQYAGRWTSGGDARSFEIVGVSEYSLSGRGTGAGQEIALDGSGRRHTTYYLDASGRYLGAAAADTAHYEATIGAAGIVLPITQYRADSLQLVR